MVEFYNKILNAAFIACRPCAPAKVRACGKLRGLSFLGNNPWVADCYWDSGYIFLNTSKINSRKEGLCLIPICSIAMLHPKNKVSIILRASSCSPKVSFVPLCEPKYCAKHGFIFINFKFH